MVSGEVYVLNDGGEVDLDLGNYERYLNVTLSRDNNITTGKIYKEVIEKEVSCILFPAGVYPDSRVNVDYGSTVPRSSPVTNENSLAQGRVFGEDRASKFFFTFFFVLL
jgi:hypothetical protein